MHCRITVDHGGKILIKFINTKLHKIGHLFHVITEKFHACKTPVVVEIDLPRSASVNTASVIANINNTELKNLAWYESTVHKIYQNESSRVIFHNQINVLLITDLKIFEKDKPN